jgi:hypothetical protein
MSSGQSVSDVCLTATGLKTSRIESCNMRLSDVPSHGGCFEISLQRFSDSCGYSDCIVVYLW